MSRQWTTPATRHPNLRSGPVQPIVRNPENQNAPRYLPPMDFEPNSQTTPTTLVTRPTYRSEDSEHLSLSSLRQNIARDNATSEIWSLLWMHPGISRVVETITQKLQARDFSYRVAWLLMQIFELQVVYRLSKQAWDQRDDSEDEDGVVQKIDVPESALLQPTQIINCALELSKRHVTHHIPPDCFMEREIQIRALVSILSLLQLFSSSRLSQSTAEILRDNINSLARDLHNSSRKASEIGDCEFMIRYARNLLTCLPGERGVGLNLAARFTNLLFATGLAYQFNGPDAIRHLQRAFRSISPRPSKWHSQLDHFHHLAMIINLWALCGDRSPDRKEFRLLCCQNIVELRVRLRDGLAQLNSNHHPTKSVFWRRLADGAAHIAGLEASTENPTHLTYGILYLIGRLVERLAAEGGPRTRSETKALAELQELLVETVQTSGFEEVRYKAYEILYYSVNPDIEMLRTLVKIRRPRTFESPSAKQERHMKNQELMKQLETHIELFNLRQKLNDKALSEIDHELIRDAIEPYAPSTRGHRSSPQHPEPICASPVLMSRDGSENSIAELSALPPTVGPSQQEFNTPSDIHHWPNPYPSQPTASAPDLTPSSPPITLEPRLTESESGSTPHLRRNPVGPSFFPAGNHRLQPGRQINSRGLNSVRSDRIHQDNGSRRSSHTINSTASDDIHTYDETPNPIGTHEPSPYPSNRIRLEGTPLGAHLSDSGETVCFRMQRKAEVYAVPLREEDRQPELKLKYAHHCSQNPRCDKFISMAVTDRFFVAVSRQHIELVDMNDENRLTLFSPFDENTITGVCCVAIFESPTINLSPSLSSNKPLSAPYIAVGVLLRFNHRDRPAIILYNVISGATGLPSLTMTRTLEISPPLRQSQSTQRYTPTPPDPPHSLSFSKDGRWLACNSTTRDIVWTWNLDAADTLPVSTTQVPRSGVDGYGRDGITSSMLFAPSSSSTFMAHSTPKSSSATYIFSTTGSSYSSAAITPRSYKSLPSSVANRALPSPPGPVTLDTPQAALFAGAVAPNSNAVAVVTKSGAVFVAPLLRGTSGRGFSFGASKEVGRVEGVAIKEGKADVKWGIVDSEKSIELEDEKQTQTHRKVVMVAALVTSGKWYKYGEVIIVGFNEHIR